MIDRTAAVKQAGNTFIAGHIGGDRAARELGLTLSELKPAQLWIAVVAIGNTRSREAVSIRTCSTPGTERA